MTSDETGSNNQVHLSGRLGGPAAVRELPSGDVLVTFRITVDRPAGDRVRVDSIECTTTKSRVRRSIVGAEAGDLVEIAGSLRRRFWRSPAGPASRYSVEVTSVRVTRAGRRGAASRDRTRASA